MPYRHNLKIIQGETYTDRIRFDSPGLDLTSCSGRGQMRASLSDVLPAAEFTVVHGEDSRGHYFDISMTAAETSAIPLSVSGISRRSVKFIYDIEIVLADLTVHRLLEGIVEVSPEATR